MDFISRSVLKDLDSRLDNLGTRIHELDNLINACTICKDSNLDDRCAEYYIDKCPNFEPKVEKINKNDTLTACVCKNCGGHLDRKTMTCEFCGTSYIL